MEGLIIRDIQPDDFPEVTRLYHLTWLETYPNAELGITRELIDESYKDAYSPENEKKRRDRVANLPKHEKYVVAVLGKKIVGVADMLVLEDKNKLRTIYVLPEFQGKGVGSALWNAVEKFRDPNKKSVVEVATYNKKAIAFYKKLGFKETGRTFYDEGLFNSRGIRIPETEFIME
ncbi:MAG TPA: GNAT family N-acetyltransferase [Candidatus Paceibacterota bacterium]|nr:GNAT family N-acetyltransferase [Candidatus Paceibacterota bacterium]